MTRAILTVLVVLTALPAAAQQLTLQIQDGLVSMTATSVPVREVLAAWARVGGTRVVGAERVAGQPLTLTLEKVPEAKALDIILRGAAGYVAAARAVPGTGSSSYDRILVLATSSPPAATAAGAARTGARTPTPPVQESVEVDTSDVTADAAADAGPMPDPAQNPFAAAFAQPGMTQQFGQPGQQVPFGQPVPFGQQTPFGQPLPFGQQPGAAPFGVPMAQPPNGTGLFQPVQPPGQPEVPQGLFGPVGSAVPGMVQQPVQQPQQRPRPQD